MGGIPRWKRFPIVLANDSKDCGLAALAAILKYHKVSVSIESLRRSVPTDLQGTSLAALATAARSLGFEVAAGQAKSDVLHEIPLPAIAHCNTTEGGHFVTIYHVAGEEIYVVDPSIGPVRYRRAEFLERWSRALLLLQGTPNPEMKDCKGRWPARYIFELFRPYLGQLATIVGSTLVAAGAAAFFSKLLSQVLNSFSFSPFHPAKQLLFWLVFVVVLRIATNLFARMMSSKAGKTFESAIGLRYLKDLLNAPLVFLETRSAGDYLSRFLEISRIRRAFFETSVSLIVDGVLLCGSCIWLLHFTLWSGIGLVVFITMVFVIVLHAGRQLFLVYLATKNYTALFHADFIEKVGNFKAIKASGAERSVRSGLKAVFNRSLDGIELAERSSLRMNALLQALSGGCLIAALLIGIRCVVHREITLGGFVMVIYLSTLLIGSIERAAPAIAAIQEASVNAAVLTDMMDHIPVDRQICDELSRAEPFPCGLLLEGVTFRYTSGPLVVGETSLRFLAGERVCVIGETGTGKSTIACLLGGLYEPSSGRIVPIDKDGNIIPGSLRQHVGIISQEAGLMSGSIESNISLGTEWINREEIEEAAVLALAHDFISAKPRGYQYEVGPKGFLLSTGQRQRIALARAFLKRPDILILDEATSGLDLDTERKILTNLWRSRAGLTTILITHRVSIAFDLDRCIMIQGGRVIADDIPSRLIKKEAIVIQEEAGLSLLRTT